MQLLSYPGGKASLAPWIISHFPPHSSYCEPFGGSAAVLLQKPRAPLEVYNDIDGELANFFRVLREPANSEELHRRLMLTPYSREMDEEPTDDSIERARRFFHRMNTRWHNGTFKRQKRNPERGTLSGVYDRARGYVQTAAKRMDGVIIESCDAVECISRYDGEHMLFYVDPPYFADRKKGLYGVEMMDEESHRRLADALLACRGSVILSGYENPLYNALFASWQKRVTIGNTMGKASKVECLWIKPSEEISRPIVVTKNTKPLSKIAMARARKAATSPDNDQCLPRGRPIKSGTVPIFLT
jgi:DNA adenine methylase